MSWMDEGSQGRQKRLKATADAHRQSDTRRHECRKIAFALTDRSSERYRLGFTI